MFLTMSLKRAHPPRQSCQERLVQGFFLKRAWRPVKAWDGVDLVEVKCHAAS